MNPDEPREWWQGITWDTPDYWARKRAQEGLQRAKLRARKDRPRRAKRAKIAKASRRQNRRAA